jgi:YD repeat-containing protein
VRGNDWLFNYDAMGRLLSIKDPLSNQIQNEYDKEGNLSSAIDSLNTRTQYVFDLHNQMIEMTNVYGDKRIAEYNSDGLPIKLTDESGHTITNHYDNEKRLLNIFVGDKDEGYQTQYIYDNSQLSYARSDSPVRIDYPTYSTQLYYDRMQRVVRSTDILSETEQQSTAYEYDAVGNITAMFDKAGRITRYTYDALRRLTQMIDPLSNVTQYQYDDRDNLLALTDANGGVTQFSYDGNDRQLTETRPMGEVTNYGYDKVGNLVEKTDAKGQLKRYQYDGANRLLQELHFTADDHDNYAIQINYTYDAEGRMLSYDDGITQGVFKYDALGRKVFEEVDYGVFKAKHDYQYHENGKKSALINSQNKQTNYLFDSADRLQSIEMTNGQRVTYNTYQWLAPTKITYPGGNNTRYNYDSLLRLTQIQSLDVIGNPMIDYTYQYNLVGNITEKATEHGTYQYG